MLRREGFDFVTTVTALLFLSGMTVADLARACGKSRSLVHMTLAGQRDSCEAKQAVADALEFNPWEQT